VRGALEWAQARALAAEGVSQREIAGRLGINRRTVARLLASDEPPRYRRAASGSQLDPLEPLIRELLAEWPRLKAPRLTAILRSECGYRGSVELVRLHLRRLRPRSVRPAQRTGYRPGQVLQLDWGMPTRRRFYGRERRIYALRRQPAVLGRADGLLQSRDEDRVLPRGSRTRLRVAGGRSARVRVRQPQVGRRPPGGKRRRLEP
jgi:transposase